MMPVWGVSEFIERALNSIPVRDDIEVIVIDDCSPDDSLDLVLKFWQNTELNMRVVHHKVNKGLSTAINTALDMAQGEYVYQFDSDDYLITEEWEKALDQLDGTDMVYVNGINDDGFKYVKYDESNHNWCAAWFYFIRKEFLGDERRVNNVYGGDYEMYIKLINKPHTKKFTGLFAYHYNYPREGSITWKRFHGEL